MLSQPGSPLDSVLRSNYRNHSKIDLPTSAPTPATHTHTHTHAHTHTHRLESFHTVGLESRSTGSSPMIIPSPFSWMWFRFIVDGDSRNLGSSQRVTNLLTRRSLQNRRQERSNIYHESSRHNKKKVRVCVARAVGCDVVCVSVYVCMYVYLCVYVCMCYVCMYVCLYVFLYVCTYLYMYVCVYVVCV